MLVGVACAPPRTQGGGMLLVHHTHVPKPERPPPPPSPPTYLLRLLLLQAGVRRGHRLLGLSDPLRTGVMWPLLDRPSLVFIRDTLRMSRSKDIEMEFSAPLGLEGKVGDQGQGQGQVLHPLRTQACTHAFSTLLAHSPTHPPTYHLPTRLPLHLLICLPTCSGSQPSCPPRSHTCMACVHAYWHMNGTMMTHACMLAHEWHDDDSCC